MSTKINKILADSSHILILGGSPKEMIDGVRYYAGITHPENLGAEAAALVQAQGIKVTLITPGPSVISAGDLINAAGHYAGGNIKAVLHLANISSIRPTQASAHKLKIKKKAGQAVPMEVVGNADIWKRLEVMFPGVPVIGYKNNQLISTSNNALTEMLISMIKEAKLDGSSSPSPVGGGRGGGVIGIDLAKLCPPPNLLPAGGGIGCELSNHKIIVTSGPTIERLTLQGDVITNLSSGKQGYAIAEALADMGAKVTLISGPASLPAPAHPHISLFRATTARDMLSNVMSALPADAYIGAAAVADFGMAAPIDLQLKENEPYTLQFVQNPDILQSVGRHPTLRPKAVIGFAAETDADKLIEYARGKLESKGADAICANLITAAGNDMNRIAWVGKDGVEPWEPMDKRAIGQAIGRRLAEMLRH